MTLRTIETELAERLIQQVNSQKTELNLSADSPVLDLQFPKLIRAELEDRDSSERELSEVLIPGWDYVCYENLEQARDARPTSDPVIDGRPYGVSEFVASELQAAFLDFGTLGTAYLSRSPLPSKIDQTMAGQSLAIFLNYALSNDLWGPKGKWPRIHGKLLDVLKNSQLLAGPPKIGYYPLKEGARKLEESGIYGTREASCYSLTLPWSLPFSAVAKIEKTIQRGL